MLQGKRCLVLKQLRLECNPFAVSFRTLQLQAVMVRTGGSVGCADHSLGFPFSVHPISMSLSTLAIGGYKLASEDSP